MATVTEFRCDVCGTTSANPIRWFVSAVFFTALIGASTPPMHTQPTAPQLAAHSFEVATIHPIDPRSGSSSGCVQPWVFPSNRFAMRCAGLKALIQLAYGDGNEKIVGSPGWIDSQLYSVNAKVEGDALLTQKQMQPLLQNLLAERFHLRVHRVKSIVSGYAVVVGKGGPKLLPTKGGPFMGATNGPCELKYRNSSIQEFGSAIGHQLLKQPVEDQTGMDGMYDFDLKFIPDDNPYTADNPTCAHVPDIFTAVQQQLGLKLVPQKVSVDTIIVDHVEQPTDN